MKHRIKHRKFSRTSAHKISMLKNLVISLIKHEQIKTTLPKAKELRPYIEKFITFARNRQSLHGRRILISRIRNLEAVNKLFGDLSERYKNRNGGYTRIMKYGFRKGDNAPMAVIELVDRQVEA